MTYNINKDIEEALKLIKFTSSYFFVPEFSTYSSIYPFTNENLNSYLNKVNVENKSVLTIAGSGDHIIELLIRNAKIIKSFDINILTKYYINLKLSAIRALEYDEFIKYLLLENNTYNTFNEASYKKIRNYLNKEDLIFWDSLYTKYPGRKIRNSYLFFNTEESYDFLKTFVSYLEPNNYYKIKAILNNPQKPFDFVNNFDNYSLVELASNYKTKFDLINLSNIADFIDEFYKDKYAERFRKYILNDLDKLLNNEGIIFSAYMFWADLPRQKDLPIINRKKIRDKYFNDKFEEWLIDNSKIDEYTNDRILVYKKK